MIDFTAYRYEASGDTLVLVITGKLDSTTSQYVLDCLQDHIANGEHKFVLDCSELTYISSVGLGTLVRANSRLKDMGGAVALAGVKGVVAEALRLVHFDRLFNMYDDVDQAAAALAAMATDPAVNPDNT